MRMMPAHWKSAYAARAQSIRPILTWMMKIMMAERPDRLAHNPT